MEDFKLFFSVGWEHIISADALDHQLFLFALVVGYVLKDMKKILILITAFTVGHSLTLVLSSLEWLVIPSDWVEFFIPVTIALTALQGYFRKENSSVSPVILYISALIFGLVHGLGFANTARMMLSQSQSLWLPLLGFNLGVEAGQILLVALIMILSAVLIRIFSIKNRDWRIGICSAVLALSLQMCIERFPF